MKTPRLSSLLVVPALALVFGSSTVQAGPPPATAPAAAAPAAAAGPAKGALQADLVMQLDRTEKQIVSLEDAVPANKFNWRPAKGVRSIAEAYLHVAYANYGLVKVTTGKEPPADTGWDSNRDKWDKRTTDKAEIKKILEQSFAYARTAIGQVPDADLDKKFDFFGTQMTVRGGLITIIAHANEHLGQSIAYARANKVTPPWSKEK
jgi:uncharacterized damage-inducible protein DinB